MIPPLRPPSNAASSSESSARSSRPGAWTATRANGARRDLSPISTSFNQHRPPTSSHESTLGSPWSPIAPASTTNAAPLSSFPRQNARSPSLTSPPPGIAPPPGLPFVGARSQTIALTSDTHPASAAAATSQGLVGGASSSAGTSSRNFRASPSLSQSSYNSPTPTSGSSLSASAQSGSVNKIVTTQLFLLLSTIRDVKKDTARWEAEAEKIRKVCFNCHHAPFWHLR